MSLSSPSPGTATNTAGSTTTAMAFSEKSSCKILSFSSALQAAVAVPIVVAIITGIVLFFCRVSRGKRRGTAVSESRLPEKSTKWTQHLRQFSFDAELLVSGRFSRSNSICSRDPDVRNDNGTASRDGAHIAGPSMLSIKEAAPPYRDAIAHFTLPDPLRSIRIVTNTAQESIPRPSSITTAPPPYRSVGTSTSRERPTSTTNRNPFAASARVSGIKELPLNDPPEAGEALGHTLSRGSSTYGSVMTDDDAAIPTASETGSTRQPIVDRDASVKTAGRTGTVNREYDA